MGSWRDLEGGVSIELKNATHDVISAQSSGQNEEADPDAFVLAGIGVIGSICLQDLLPKDDQELQGSSNPCSLLA